MQHQFQFAPEEVDITQADIKHVPVEVTFAAINLEVEIVEAGIIAAKSVPVPLLIPPK